MSQELMNIINEKSFAKNNNKLEEENMKKLLVENLNNLIYRSKFNFEKLPINPKLSGVWLKKLFNMLKEENTKIVENKTSYRKVNGYEIFVNSTIKLQNEKDKLTFNFITTHYPTEDNKSPMESSFIVNWLENDDKTIYNTYSFQNDDYQFLDQYLNFERWNQIEFDDIDEITESIKELKNIHNSKQKKRNLDLGR